MPLQAAYIFPHPPLAVPAVGGGQELKIKKTLASLDNAAQAIASLSPETIIFITPHSTVYADYFHISPGAKAKGDLSKFRAEDTIFSTGYDTELIAEICELVSKNDIPAGCEGENDAALDHGFTVPMWFVNRRYTDYKSIRISPSGLNKSQHYRFGQCIKEAVDKSKKRVVIIASGDLSHKLSVEGPYGYATEGTKFDAAITEIFSQGDFLSLFNISELLREKAAECGYNPFLILAGCLDRQKVNCDLMSYEGPFGVGYAVAGIIPGEADESRNFLVQYEEIILKEARDCQSTEDAYRSLARRSLEQVINTGTVLSLPTDLPDELINTKAGAFVTLYKQGRLRGCIGTIFPNTECVAEEIIKNAVSAGLNDTRFEPVTKSELEYLNYKVDILGTPERISNPLELDVKRYGVIVTSGYKRGLLLPNLEGIDTVAEQIEIARRKGGIRDDEEVILERFEVTRHE